MPSNGGKTQRKTSLFSLADWKFHNNRLGYDDLVDGRGRLVVTVNVMDLARDEMLSPAYVAGGTPKRLLVLENDNCWTIYLNVRWLTPKTIQRALDELGKIVHRRFVFQPYRLPSNLARKYRKAAERMRGEVERARARGELKSANEVFRKFRGRGARRKTKSNVKPIVAPKRMIEISTHKLKF